MNRNLFIDYTYRVVVEFDGKIIRKFQLQCFDILTWLKKRGVVDGQIFKVYTCLSNELLYTKDMRNGIIKRSKRDLK